MSPFDEVMISLGLTPSGDPRPQHAKCGTRPGYLRHRKNKEEACAPCRAANAAYVQARHHAPKDPAALPPIDHGTVRGARQHHYRGQRACQPCRDAYNADRSPKR
ncbi:MAG TPA: hypothetical protein VNO54_23630, partial [Streptosporangiaceae bacterium]|nr:hypothetical protein [Streptosporangiaceae bacterium]